MGEKKSKKDHLSCRKLLYRPKEIMGKDRMMKTTSSNTLLLMVKLRTFVSLWIYNTTSGLSIPVSVSCTFTVLASKNGVNDLPHNVHVCLITDL